MVRFSEEFDLPLNRGLSMGCCIAAAEGLSLDTQIFYLKATPRILATDLVRHRATAVAVDLTVDFTDLGDDLTNVEILGSSVGRDAVQEAQVRQQVNLLANYMEKAASLFLDRPVGKTRPTGTHSYNIDLTTNIKHLKGASENLAKRIAGGVFKKAQGAVKKTQSTTGPNETVLLKIPASLYRHDNTKDRINEYARENLTTPLRIGTRAVTWLLDNRYEVGGRMTVTTRRLLFEPGVLMVGEPLEEIVLEEIAEVVDAGGFWDRRMGIVHMLGDKYLFVVEHKRKVMELLEEWVRRVRESPGSLDEEPPPVHTDFKEGKKGVGELYLDLSDKVRGATSVTGMGKKLTNRAWDRMRKGKGTSSGDLSSELEKLADLREHGVLSEEEFRRAKARLIDG